MGKLGGLEGGVGERGSRLSQGEKQLVCLARAMLLKAKVRLTYLPTWYANLGPHHCMPWRLCAWTRQRPTWMRQRTGTFR